MSCKGSLNIYLFLHATSLVVILWRLLPRFSRYRIIKHLFSGHPLGLCSLCKATWADVFFFKAEENQPSDLWLCSHTHIQLTELSRQTGFPTQNKFLCVDVFKSCGCFPHKALFGRLWGSSKNQKQTLQERHLSLPDLKARRKRMGFSLAVKPNLMITKCMAGESSTEEPIPMRTCIPEY